MAIASNLLKPSDTALNKATLSPQIVNPKDTFSTLHPLKTLPSFVLIAAPILNFE